MDNQDDLKKPISQLAKPAPEKPRAPKIKAMAAKPIVEGINSAKNSGNMAFMKPAASVQKPPDLTEQEKILVAEPLIPEKSAEAPAPMLMPQSVVNRANKKPHRVKGILMAGLIILIIIVGGYMGYLWRLNSISSGPINSNPPPSDSQLITEPIYPATGTSTPATDTTPSLAAEAPGTPATSTASSTPPAAPVTQLKVNSTPTGYLNVRSLPSTSGTIIAKVHPGDVYIYTAVQPGWYQITLTDGTSGWVSAQYVTTQ